MKKRYLNLLKRILVTAISVSMIIQPVAPVLAEEADGYAETVEVGGSSEEDVTLDAEDTEDITAEAGADEAPGQADSIEGQTDSVEGQADAVEGQSGAETLDDAAAAVLSQTEATIAENDPDFEAVQSEEAVEVSGVEEEVEAEGDEAAEEEENPFILVLADEADATSVSNNTTSENVAVHSLVFDDIIPGWHDDGIYTGTWPLTSSSKDLKVNLAELPSYEDYFKIYPGASTAGFKVKMQERTIGEGEDAFTGSYCVNINGRAQTYADYEADTANKANWEGNDKSFAELQKHPMRNISFTTSNNAVVKIWWNGGGEETKYNADVDGGTKPTSGGREMRLWDKDAKIVGTTNDNDGDHKQNLVSEIKIENPGTYYLANLAAGSGTDVYRVDVIEYLPVKHELNFDNIIPGWHDDGIYTGTWPLTSSSKDLKVNLAELPSYEDYFKIYPGASTAGFKVKMQERTIGEGADAFTGSYCVNINGRAQTYADYEADTANKANWEGNDKSFAELQKHPMRNISFTTDGAAEVKIWWNGGGEETKYNADVDGGTKPTSGGREIRLWDKDAKIVGTTNDNDGDHKQNLVSTLKVTEAGTYYLANLAAGSGTDIYRIVVTEVAGFKVKDWSEVETPSITGIANAKVKGETDFGAVEVKVSGEVSDSTTDKVTVYMLKSSTDVANYATDYVLNASVAGGSGSATFEPTASDEYQFIAVATRTVEVEDGEEAPTFEPKISAISRFDFRLPLEKAGGLSATNEGNKIVKVMWAAVDEADYYVVSVSGNDALTQEVTDTEVKLNFSSLAMDKDYTVSVQAFRDNTSDSWKESWTWNDSVDKSEASSLTFTAKNKKEIGWNWVSYGASTTGEENLEDLIDKDGNKGRGSTANKAAGKYQNGYIRFDDAEGNMVKLRNYSTRGAGKILPDSMQDGVSFYYTAIPSNENFTLSARAHVNNWVWSNGQEGFGLMAADRIYGFEAEPSWNNNVMAAVTKGKYKWDPVTKDFTDDAEKASISMYLGPTAMVRYGLNENNFGDMAKRSGEIMNTECTILQEPLEHFYSDKGGGMYNLVGNFAVAHDFDPDVYTYAEGPINSSDKSDHTRDQVDFDLKIRKTNSGYSVTYTYAGTDPRYAGWTMTRDYVDTRYFDATMNPVDLDVALSKKGILDQLDSKYTYVGMFTARNADVTFSNIVLETIDPKDDEAAKKPAKNYMNNGSNFTSAANSNTTDYTLTYLPTWKGKLKISSGTGKVIYDSTKDTNYAKDGMVSPDVYIDIPVSLTHGANEFTAEFDPDKNYHYGYDESNPEATGANFNNVLTSYERVTSSLTVNYRSYGEEGTYLYVSPEGTSAGKGTIEKPLDIYTAVKYVQPGQQILLGGGTYRLTSPVRIERGIDGEVNKRITMLPDPDLKGERPVFNFMGQSEGIIAAGNYWTIKGIEVTNTMDQKKGLSVAGSYNIVENVVAHHCGNNGIEISRLKATDTLKSTRESATDEEGNSRQCKLWPHDNLILNCTSYENADAGFEDADGFACKLTTGPRNVFDGCLAYFNADDGWDFYSKTESGEIGRVIIKNSVTYGNGYIHRDKDKDGKAELISAGNGNGFKMGGEGLPGGHTVINCFSFYNKLKGIESNNCCDIKAYNSISYDNENYNFSFHTIGQRGTDYAAKNIISFRDDKSTPKVADREQKTYLSVDYPQDRVMPYDDDDRKGAENIDKIWNDYTYFFNLKMYKKGAGKDEVDKDFDYTVNVAKNKAGTEFKPEYFKSLDFDLEKDKITRNADGTLNMGDFLQLTDEGFEALGLEKFGIGSDFPSYMDDDAYLLEVGSSARANTVDNAEDLAASSGIVERGTNDSDGSNTSAYPDVESIELKEDTVVVGTIKDQYYTGKAILPEILMVDGKGDSATYLVKGKDYYYQVVGNNVNAGVVELNVVGMGNYTGKYLYEGGKKVTFNILPISLREGAKVRRYNKDTLMYEDIEVIETDGVMAVKADGKEKKPVPTIMFNNGKGLKKLSAGKDFTISYLDEAGNEVQSFKDANTAGKFYTIVVKGKNTLEETTGEGAGENKGGNFSGTRNITFLLYNDDKPDIKTLKLNKIPVQYLDLEGNQPFNLKKDGTYAKNSDQTKAEELVYPIEDMTLGLDYTVSYSKNKKKGSAVALIAATGTRYSGVKQVKFRIKPAKLQKTKSKATVLVEYRELQEDGTYKWVSIDGVNIEKEYTGNPVTLNSSIRVKYSGPDNLGNASTAENPKALINGKDYKIEYRRAIHAGKATAIVKGKGAYNGKFVQKYVIKPVSNENFKKYLGKNLLISTQADSDEYGYFRNYRRDEGKVSVEVEFNGVLLKEGKDYNLIFAGNNVISKPGEHKSSYQVKFTDAIFGTANNTTYNEACRTNGGATTDVNEMVYDVREGSLDSATAYITAKDMVWKANSKVSTKFEIIEFATGKKLKSGTDFSRQARFTYDSDVKDGSGNLLAAKGQAVSEVNGGKLVEPDDDGYNLIISVDGQNRYSGTITNESYPIHVAKNNLLKSAVTKELKVTYRPYDSKTYTGVELEEYFGVTDADLEGLVTFNNEKLVRGVDYEVDTTFNIKTHKKDVKMYFRNNTIGTAYVVIRGLGKYAGNRNIYFRVLPRDVSNGNTTTEGGTT